MQCREVRAAGGKKICRLALGFALASILTFFSSPHAVAQGRTGRVVMANGSAPVAFLDALEQASLAQLADVKLGLTRLAAAAPAPADLRARMDGSRGTDALAVFWVDEDIAGHKTLLHLYDPRGDRMLVRTFPLAGEATAEGIALVVRSSALALAEGGSIGVEVPRVEERRPPPAAIAPPPPPDADRARGGAGDDGRSNLSIGVAYAGVGSTSLGFWRSGAEIAIRARVRGATFAGVGLRVLSRIEVRDPAVTLSITSYPIELFVGHAFAWRSLTFAPKLGLIGEISERSATVFEPRLMPTADRGVFVLGAGPQIEATFALTRWLAVRLAGGVDVLFNPPEYVVDVPAHRVVAEADRVRPRAELGLLVRAW